MGEILSVLVHTVLLYVNIDLLSKALKERLLTDFSASRISPSISALCCSAGKLGCVLSSALSD